MWCRNALEEVLVQGWEDAGKVHWEWGYNKKDEVETSSFLVALEGFEPSQTEPESVVLPLHHKAMFGGFAYPLICDCKGTTFL